MDGDERASAVLDAFGDMGEAEVRGFDTSGGPVSITNVVAGDGSNVVVVSVTSGIYSQEVVIVNPPVYFPDPDGDTEVNGTMFRYDPAAAVAEAIGMHAGAN